MTEGKKRVAIIGAGFAGLGSSYYLLQNGGFEVVVYDQRGVGGGASGMAAGLVHPYVGEQVRRSVLSTEALSKAKELIQKAQHYASAPLASFTGIERVAQTIEQQNALEKHAQEHKDVEHLGGGRFFISSGFTVFAASYLQALWQACSAMGAVIVNRKVKSLDDLSDFDVIIVAAGGGIFGIEPLSGFALGYTKGHTICSKLVEPLRLPCSLIGKGYVAITEDEHVVCLGSTYERGYRDTDPDKDFAVKAIEEKVSSLVETRALSFLSVQAGLRVSVKGHYLPLVGPVTDKMWVFTGLGSRGLLYHALFASILVEAISSSSEDPIPAAVRLSLSKNRSSLYNKLKV